MTPEDPKPQEPAEPKGVDQIFTARPDLIQRALELKRQREAPRSLPAPEPQTLQPVAEEDRSYTQPEPESVTRSPQEQALWDSAHRVSLRQSPGDQEGAGRLADNILSMAKTVVKEKGVPFQEALKDPKIAHYARLIGQPVSLLETTPQVDKATFDREIQQITVNMSPEEFDEFMKQFDNFQQWERTRQLAEGEGPMHLKVHIQEAMATGKKIDGLSAEEAQRSREQLWATQNARKEKYQQQLPAIEQKVQEAIEAMSQIDKRLAELMVISQRGGVKE